MKKYLLKVLMVAVSSGCVFSSGAYTFEKDGIYYDVLAGTSNVAVTFKDKQYASYSGDVVIPETVTHEGKVYTVTEIGKYGIRNSSELTSIKLPETLEAIGSGAFSKCSKLKKIVIPDKVTSIASLAIQDCPELSEIILGKSIEKIQNNAFMGDVALKRIDIPLSVKEIAGGAFSNCTTLVAAKIPASVTTLGNNVFQGCMAFTNYDVDEANTTYCTVDGVLFSKDKKTLIAYPAGRTVSEYTVPEGVTTLAYSSFYQRIIKIGVTTYGKNDCLEKINLPSTLVTIGNSAFEDLEKMKEISIPASVTSIGNASFRACTSLTSVIVPDNVTKLDLYSFKNCTAVKTVYLGKSVESIGKESFTGCPNITTVTSMAVVPPTSKGAFFDADVAAKATLVVPKGSVDAYKAAAYWSAFANIQASEMSGIADVESTNEAVPVATYNAAGIQVPEMTKGLNIVKMSDGTSRKVIVR